MQVAFRTFAVQLVFKAIFALSGPWDGRSGAIVAGSTTIMRGAQLLQRTFIQQSCAKKSAPQTLQGRSIRLTDQAHLLGKIEAPIWTNRRGYAALLLISGLWRLRLEPGS
jgi:hypothetical protein